MSRKISLELKPSAFNRHLVLENGNRFDPGQFINAIRAYIGLDPTPCSTESHSESAAKEHPCWASWPANDGSKHTPVAGSTSWRSVFVK